MRHVARTAAVCRRGQQVCTTRLLRGNWLGEAHLKTRLLFLHPPLLSVQPTATEELLAIDHVVSTHPTSSRTRRQWPRGWGPGNCSCVCACWEVVIVVMFMWENINILVSVAPPAIKLLVCKTWLYSSWFQQSYSRGNMSDLYSRGTQVESQWRH